LPTHKGKKREQAGGRWSPLLNPKERMIERIEL